MVWMYETALHGGSLPKIERPGTHSVLILRVLEMELSICSTSGLR